VPADRDRDGMEKGRMAIKTSTIKDDPETNLNAIEDMITKGIQVAIEFDYDVPYDPNTWNGSTDLEDLSRPRYIDNPRHEILSSIKDLNSFKKKYFPQR
jgi:hypothetical protein